MTPTDTPNTVDYWPCACTRTRNGRRQMKLNAPSVERCLSCGACKDGELPEDEITRAARHKRYMRRLGIT